MNIVQRFLAHRSTSIDVDSIVDSSRLQCIMLTPRFRASAHVIFLLFDHRNPNPVLVAKIPRAGGDRHALSREATNLRTVQSLREGGFSSIPRVVAFEEFAGTWMLLESALPGRVMHASTVRRDPDRCARLLVSWTTDLHVASATQTSGFTSIDRLLFNPLAEFERSLHPRSPLATLCVETRQLVQPLREVALPTVFEHGDLGAPNILLSRDGGPGVVDWELGDPLGMPAADLFFMLTYLAFAQRQATRGNDYETVFQRAFFGPAAWAGVFIEPYRRALGLPDGVMAPLFIATWARYVMTLARRTSAEDASVATLTSPNGWLTGNRFATLWRYALDHATDLHLCEGATRPLRRAGALSHRRSPQGA
jgi:aminoglycoside phosphotransferase (APT) family kinase protein